MSLHGSRQFPIGLLVALVAVLSLVMAAGGYAYYHREAATIQAERYAELRTIASLKIGQITSWREDQLGDARLSASQPWLGDLVNRCLQHPLDTETHRAIKQDLSLIQESHAFQNVILLDAEGRLLDSLDPKMDRTEAPVKELAERTLQEGRAVIGDLYRCSLCGETHLDAAAPIHDQAGKVVGLLIVRSNPETRLYPLIQSWPTPSETAETLLVRKEGSEVVFLNRLRHQQIVPLSLRIPVAQADLPAAQAVLGRTGEFLGRDYRGEEVVAELRPVPDSPWFMVAKVDAREILAEVHYRGWVVLGFTIMGITVLVSLLTALLLFGEAKLYQDLFQATHYSDQAGLEAPAGRTRQFKLIARVCGLASFIIGLFVLAGWTFGISSLQSLLPGFVTMKANTALGFVAGGLALVWSRDHRLQTVCAVVLVALGGMTLSEYLFGLNLHIDQILFHEPPGTIGTLAPGRMAPGSALCFLLSGIAFLSPTRGRAVVLAQGIGVTVGLTGLAALLGYLFGPLGQYGIGYFLQLAIPTGVGFMALGLGLLLQEPGQGLLRTFSADSMGGWLFRRTIPFLIGLPIILSWIRTVAENHQWIEPGLGRALLVISFIVLLVTAVGWISRSLGRLDMIRREAESQVREGAEEIKATLYGIGDGVIATDVQGHIIHMNPVAERLTGWLEAEALGRPLGEVFKLLSEESRQSAEDPVLRVLRDGKVVGLANHTLLIARDGTEIPIADSGAPVLDSTGVVARVVLVFRDQTEERRLEHLMQIRMSLVDYATDHSMDELLVRTLDDVGRMVGSPIGFYHFYDEETGNLTLQQWSTRTRNEYCKAEGQGAHYPLEMAGVWVDAVRQRRAVIHNDYASLPHRKGLPEGHAALVRELVVPVFRGERIVAVLGVGNKAADYTGKDVESVHFLADVTWSLVEGKYAEKALRDSEQRYRRLHDSLRDAYVQVDMGGRIVEHNPQYSQLLGYSGEELRSLTYMDLTPSKWHDLETRIVKEEILVKGHSPVYEKEYRRKDGSLFPVELRTFLLCDDQGKPSGMWAIVRDITERKRAEEALRLNELKYRQLIETTETGFVIVGNQGEVLDSNSIYVRLSGHDSFDQIRGRSVLEWTAEYHRDRNIAAVRKCMEDGYIRDFEIDYVGPGGATIPIEINATVIGTGDEIRILTLCRDITERKAAESEMQRLLEVTDRSRRALLSLLEDQRSSESEIWRLNLDLERRVEERTLELAAANKELEAFAYSVSHDLRAPLRHMHGFLSMLARQLGENLDVKGAHFLNVAQGAAVRMGQLVDGLLSFSRLGRAELHQVDINAEQLVASVIDEFKAECSGRKIIWKVGILPKLRGDPTLLRLVFQNLIGNAVKFTRNRTEGLIEIQPIGGLEEEVGISIRDNGVGFDPAYAHKLFGVFQRLHREDEFEGTGIGLANVQRIMARHGGRVWAESRLGEEATFFLAFPMTGSTP
jgi:PAS domain S-box-containing protein